MMHVWSQAFFKAVTLASLVSFLQGRATLPPPVERSHDAAIPASQSEFLGQLASSCGVTQDSPTTNSSFRPLPLSAFSMDARLSLARKAQRSLDVQYYLLQNDVTGHALLRAMRDAAVR